MSASTVSAQSVTDDDGTGTTGTIWNAAFQAAFEAAINALFSSTTGLRLNQGAGGGGILFLESSNVAHGMTSLTGTDVFLQVGKSDGASGGASIVGLTEATVAIEVVGIGTTDVTTKTTGSNAQIVMAARTRSGTSSTDVASNGNLLAVRNNNTTRFILDADGDSHQDVGTAWTNFDDFDDVALLTALSVGVSRSGDPLRESFASYLEEHRESLERGRFVTFNADGHHFINWTRTHMLVIGAVRQLGARLNFLETRLAMAGGERASLEG